MKSVSHTKSFEIACPVADLFPLFSPEGEKSWVPGWDYENVMGTTELSEDYIFLTRRHDHGTTGAIWIVKRYDPRSHFIQFYKIEPQDKIGVVAVKCTDLGAEITEVRVTYTYMALSETGERFVSGFSADAYQKFIGEWRAALENYFKKRERFSSDS